MGIEFSVKMSAVEAWFFLLFFLSAEDSYSSTDF